MQWVAGFWPRRDAMNKPVVFPKNSHAHNMLWNVGYECTEFRRFSSGSTTVTVVGSCLATDVELNAALPAADSERWEIFAQWPGSYIAVVQRAHEAVVITDLAGAKPVFWVKTDSGWWWSTAATPLAALMRSKVNIRALLTPLMVAGVDAWGGETPYEKVMVVKPGSVLRLSHDGPKVETWYKPTVLSFAEGQHNFRAALTDSVGRRAALGDISSDLSGGIDSSLIALLASRLTVVHGATYVDPWQRNDDADYARRVAGFGGIRQILVEGDQTTTHYSDLDEAPFTDTPSADGVLFGYNRAKLQAVKAAGSRHHLTGAAGDCMLLSPYPWVAELYKHQRLQALRWARQEARRRLTSSRRFILATRRLATTSFANEAARLAGGVEVAEKTAWSSVCWLKWMESAIWLTEQGRSMLCGRLEEISYELDPPENPGANLDWQSLRATAIERTTAVEFARSIGITLHNPFFDTQVIDACLSIPGYERAPLDTFKPLATLGFMAELPEFLRQRRTKGDFAGTMLHGILFNQHWLKRMIESSALVEMGLIDRDQLRQSVQSAIYGFDTQLRGIHHLTTIEMWLRSRDLRPTVWWEML
ncbi:MAG TPA: albusnodin/ikarugamycin family macrolactam cyclase [Candidatus Saccharimonadales bacterium]|nr:albusnodin/ikarugamycin family macrolactam cyclase [Candidatus Saccharimonadales bacterium]